MVEGLGQPLLRRDLAGDPPEGPEARIGPADNPAVQDVAHQARLLQASLLGHRTRDSFYEAYEPDGDDLGGGTSVPAIAGLNPEHSRKLNLWLGRGGGMRVQPSLDEQFTKAQEDYHAVWKRARAYGDAVLALIRDCA
ncbi:hypothetical protein [Streptomyces sp. RKAG337]|uniref:hypothetical protein n=1 Tax=Streptomyces sp. RKAG337 TaxID=2893404 RepID=UPI002033E26E|nr:hypothetical protein [Streptomyces sp. RKAG337]MCM2430976.1 hypothetical protein [Streptomyces sp. RKAG337]